MSVAAIAASDQGRDLFSFFRTPFPDVVSGDPADAPPTDPDSADIVARLAWELPRDGQHTAPPWNAPAGRPLPPYWGPKLHPRVPVYKVAAGQSTQPLSADGDNAFDQMRAQLGNEGVPIPAGAEAANPTPGSDQGMAVWNPGADTAWFGCGMDHVVKDMSFYPPNVSTEIALSTPLAGQGTLQTGKAYFYRASAVVDGVGESGARTVITSGYQGKVALVIPASNGSGAQLRIYPRYLIDSINIYRCEASNSASASPGTPVGSPPNGQDAHYHRHSGTGICYRWNGTTWVFLNAPWPYSADFSDASFKLVAQIEPADKPTLFAIDGVLTNYTEAGAATIDSAKVIPSQSTAIFDADTWRSFWVSTVRNVSASPGYGVDIASGPGSPQERTWPSSATKILESGGLINKRDFDRGEIDHVMTWAIHSNGGAGVSGNTETPPEGGWSDSTRHAYPAQSRDPGAQHDVIGTTLVAAGCPSNALAIPEGARFRFPADFNLQTQIFNTAAFLALSADQALVCRMVATAMKNYGLITSDGTGVGTNIHCAWPSTEDPTDPTAALPSFANDGRGGTTWRPGWADESPALKPTSIGGPFPWHLLEVVRMGWGPGYAGDPADLTPCASTAIACPVGGQ